MCGFPCGLSLPDSHTWSLQLQGCSIVTHPQEADVTGSSQSQRWAVETWWPEPQNVPLTSAETARGSSERTRLREEALEELEEKPLLLMILGRAGQPGPVGSLECDPRSGH